MTRTLLAALALACVASSALAVECPSAEAGWDWISYTVFFAVFAVGIGISVWRQYRRARRDMQAWADHLRGTR